MNEWVLYAMPWWGPFLWAFAVYAVTRFLVKYMWNKFNPSDPTMDEDEARSERQFLLPINPDPITKRIQNEKPLPKKKEGTEALRKTDVR